MNNKALFNVDKKRENKLFVLVFDNWDNTYYIRRKHSDGTYGEHCLSTLVAEQANTYFDRLEALT